MAQDGRGVMYYATQSGILEFDGRNWEVLRGESAVYDLHITEKGDIFWAGAKGFGQITYDADGFQHLDFLSEANVRDVFQMTAVRDEVFFLKDDALFIYNTDSKKTLKLPATDLTSLFTNIFELYGAVYINTLEAGVYRVNNGKLIQSKLSFSADVVFASRVEDRYVIGTTDNRILVCGEDLQPHPITLKDQEYVDASVVVSGTWINPKLMALGTLRGGVVFVNPLTGQTEQIVNYDTGLPDNEVFALFADRNNDVWVAHDYGFSRVSPFMPLRSFSHYQGLKGNLLCAYSAEGSVYVGTSLGLFKLQKEDVYDEIVYYVDVEIPDKAKTTTGTETKQNTKDPEASPKSERKGLFNFLKRKKNKTNETGEAKTPASESSSQAVTPSSGREAPKTRREKRTQRILRASQNVYKKVNGIDAKVSMLLEINGTLIASGLGGIFEVKGLEAKPILERPVRFVFASAFHNMLFAATYDNQVESVVKTSAGWKEISFLEDLDDQIDFIFEGNENEVWICGLNDIYQLGIKDQKVETIHDINIPNPEVESTFGVSVGDKILFANGSGFYSFDHANDLVSRVDSLPAPLKYFASEGNIFYRDTHGWHVSGLGDRESNLQLLNLFPDLRFISSDQRSGNFWMISGSNSLYKFHSNGTSFEGTPFPLFLKSIYSDNKRTGRQDNLHLSEDKSAVTFEIVQPDFVSPEAIEFRYALAGMTDAWSEWSSKNAIEFPYLPPGEYNLQVQSRNVFGKVVELSPVKFEVLPPYWKRSWFYAMEFAILSTLVLLSFRLNNRYRIVSRILSLLTIILLIEFIQTLISSTIHFEQQSPVFDFIIQVGIALMILPVEGFLRNLMLGSLNGTNKLSKLVVSRRETSAILDEAENFHPAEKE